MTLEEFPLTEAFAIIVQIALGRGAKNIKDLPGPWTMQEGKVFIAVNATKENHMVQIPEGGEFELEPYFGLVVVNGWIVFHGTPGGGRCFMITEDELIRRLEAVRDQEVFTA